MTYLDTSALIKRFVVEKGSILVQKILAQEVAIVTAKIAYAEVYAGLSRKRREGAALPDLSFSVGDILV